MSQWRKLYTAQPPVWEINGTKVESSPFPLGYKLIDASKLLKKGENEIYAKAAFLSTNEHVMSPLKTVEVWYSFNFDQDTIDAGRTAKLSGQQKYLVEIIDPKIDHLPEVITK